MRRVPGPGWIARAPRLLALSALLALGGCVTDPIPVKATKAETMAREALLEADAAFSRRAGEVGVAAAFREYIAEDATMLPAATDALRGREAIFQRLQEQGEDGLTWQPQAAEVARSGDFGYTWGTFQLPAREADGQMTVVRGKYVSVWRKQVDGAWKVILDIGNTIPPARP